MATQTRIPDSDRRAKPVRRGLSLAGLAAVAFASLTALSWFIHSSDTVTIDQTITRVEVDVSSGHVEIVGSAAGETSLEFEAKSGWSRDGRVEHEVDGSTLRVYGGCDSGVFLGLWCKSDVKLTVPADATVIADATHGAMTVTGLSADADLGAHGGDLRVENHSGELTAHSAGGSVTVAGLEAEVAKVTSSGGDVSVDAARPPRSLDAESSAGDVSVTLPGQMSYDVETDSSIGDVTVDVPERDGSMYEVRAFSSAGRVAVTAR